MAEQAPNIYPALQYADAEAAREWLSKAFGFEDHVAYRNDQGAINHAEMTLGPSMIMFGQGEPGSPGIYVAVEDADAHYERAKAAGAEITREIEDTFYGSREYTAKDPEGHVWSFGTYWPKKGDPPVSVT
jgi:uncharacterized glyoxalase superfamily protein PhnB